MKLLAMEFTTEYIHIFQMDSSQKGSKIERALHLPMPQNCYVGGMLINNDRSVSDLIMTTLKEEKIKEKRVVVAVSGIDCMTEEFSVPDGKPKIIAGMVEQELLKRRKLGASLIFDYLVTGKDLVKDGFVKIKAVICPKALVNNYYDVIKKAGLIPQAFDLSSHAMQHIAEKSCLTTSPEISILACVNKDELHFIYCGKNEDPYYRHASIKQDDGIDESLFVLSANNKFNFGLDSEETVIEEFIENVTKLNRFHSSRHPDDKISCIYIYGDYDNLQLICDRVENAVGIRARCFNVVTSVSGLTQKSMEPIKGCINVVGGVMAMNDGKPNNFEFFSKLVESKQDKTHNLFWLPSIISLVVLIAVLISYVSVTNNNRRMEKDIDDMTMYIYGGDNLEKYYLIQKYIDNIDACYAYNNRVLRLMTAMDNKERFDSSIPELIRQSVIDGVAINSFSFTNGRIEIGCTGDYQTSAADFTRKLSSLPEFTEVKYEGFSSTTQSDGSLKYSFSLILVPDEKVVDVDAILGISEDEGGDE